MDLNSILDTATIIARDAGALLLDGFGREKQIETKSSAVDFVTQFDRAAETLITDRLRAAFPGHGLLGEEGTCLLYTSPSPRDRTRSRMPSSA